MNDRYRLVACKYCGARTPSDNFNCIYCGSAIFENSGFLGRLRYGKGGLYFILITLFIVISFIIWFVI